MSSERTEWPLIGLIGIIIGSILGGVTAEYAYKNKPTHVAPDTIYVAQPDTISTRDTIYVKLIRP